MFFLLLIFGNLLRRESNCAFNEQFASSPHVTRKSQQFTAFALFSVNIGRRTYNLVIFGDLELGLVSFKMDRSRQHQSTLHNYINGCLSSRIFAPPKEKQCCPDSCDTFSSSSRTNQCLTKNWVYKIKCSHCDVVLSTVLLYQE